MRNWLRDHGLLLANFLLFAVFFGGMAATGFRVYNDNQAEHGQAIASVAQYLTSGDFMEATFENWESEFLQMASYIVLTVFLFQRGSSESKSPDAPAPEDEDPHEARIHADTPWPVARGGILLKLYENSLAGLFVILFLGSVLLHAVGGSAAYSAEEAAHGGSAVTVWQYFGTAQFWFESFQNWQSEFLAVAILVGASVYLRQRGSAESKPVAAGNQSTG
ncbi:MAG: hypothetical protein JWM49_2589 [Microbacteriaceae bacterium]|nr:hypothetical protein [Microbacteriaceae bacterium]